LRNISAFCESFFCYYQNRFDYQTTVSISTRPSIITGRPNGKACTPIAERACIPISEPYNERIRSEKPLATSVVCVNPELQQELIDKKHPDHTLITYPNLGHAFYPSSEWVTSVAGPMPPYVLADLYSWLESHSGFTHIATPISSSRVSSSSSPTAR
jgi:hypothetical protein